MTDYDKILTDAWADVPEEVIIPAGHWLTRNCGVAFIKGKQRVNKTTGAPVLDDHGNPIYNSGQLLFFHSPVEPLGDVNQKELKALNGADWTQNEIRSKDTFWFGSMKDKRAIMDHLSKYKGLPQDIGILVVDEENSTPERVEYKVNPELRKALSGKEIVAKISIDEYKGQAQNVASDFVPVSA